MNVRELRRKLLAVNPEALVIALSSPRFSIHVDQIYVHTDGGAVYLGRAIDTQALEEHKDLYKSL